MEKKQTIAATLTPDSSLHAYIKKVNGIPILTLEEENELTERFWKEMDFAAAQKLVLAHLRLVVKIAQNFKSYDLPMQDMISEGNMGLMKAVQKFSPSVGSRLATYASWWIRAAIQEYILSSWTMVKVSTNAMKRKLFYKLQQTKHCIMNFARMPEEEGLTLTQLQPISLDAPKSDQNNYLLIDTIPSDEFSHAEKLIAYDEDQKRKHLLQKEMKNLNEREKNILQRRRLKKVPDKLGDIASEYGISPERVRQIEEKIITRLRAAALKESWI